MMVVWVIDFIFLFLLVSCHVGDDDDDDCNDDGKNDDGG